jgi:hypothetical protein
MLHGAAGVVRLMGHDAAGIGRIADHDAAGIVRSADHDAAGGPDHGLRAIDPRALASLDLGVGASAPPLRCPAWAVYGVLPRRDIIGVMTRTPRHDAPNVAHRPPQPFKTPQVDRSVGRFIRGGFQPTRRVVVREPPDPRRVVVRDPPDPRRVVVRDPPDPRRVVVRDPPDPRRVVIREPHDPAASWIIDRPKSDGPRHQWWRGPSRSPRGVAGYGTMVMGMEVVLLAALASPAAEAVRWR